MAQLHVLVAEDDPAIRTLVTHHLEVLGFAVTGVGDGSAALRAARTLADLVVLDVGLPGIDGFEVARILRREGHEVPILMLTARTDEVDRIVGLELGADDYLCKPFAPRELVARIKAVVRRSRKTGQHEATLHAFGRLEIDEAAREVRVDGNAIHFKPREYHLLLTLASNPGLAFSRRTLLEKIWGFDFNGDERTVDVHVRRLRQRLEEQCKLPPVLQTVRNYGYKFMRP